jgi:glutamate-1-semialdehyde 2,1-aminomutase
MYAGIAGAKVLTRDVIQDVNALGDYLRSSVSQLLISRNIIPAASTSEASDQDNPDIDNVPRGQMWVSGIGSINTVHFGRNDELTDLRDLFYFHMLEDGIYIARRSFIA